MSCVHGCPEPKVGGMSARRTSHGAPNVEADDREQAWSHRPHRSAVAAPLLLTWSLLAGLLGAALVDGARGARHGLVPVQDSRVPPWVAPVVTRPAASKVQV